MMGATPTPSATPTATREPMNVLYCGDGYIEQGVLLSVLSLVRHTDLPLRIHVLTARVGQKAPVSAAFVAHLDELLRARDPRSAGVLIDATQAFASQPPTANLGTRFTPCCMLRLYADLVEGLPDHLLYLDNDVVCLADPAELYDTALDGAEFAGVLDYYGRFFFRRRLLHMDYMNSGVLVMDLARMRQTGLLAACRARCANEKMFMPDQTSLNELARAKRILPRRFNDQRRTHEDTVMRHYSNCFGFFPPRLISVKPWDIDRMHEVLGAHELDDLYEEFQQEWDAYRHPEQVGQAPCHPERAQRVSCHPERSRAQHDGVEGSSRVGGLSTTEEPSGRGNAAGLPLDTCHPERSRAQRDGVEGSSRVGGLSTTEEPSGRGNAAGLPLEEKIPVTEGATTREDPSTPRLRRSAQDDNLGNPSTPFAGARCAQDDESSFAPPRMTILRKEPA